MYWELTAGFAAGFVASMILFGLVFLARRHVDVIGAITRAWFTSASVYLFVFGTAYFAAIAHGYTGVYIGGPFASAGVGYAIALLMQLAACALVFATGYDIEAEAKRLARASEKK